jgi:hypothetical protein
MATTPEGRVKALVKKFLKAEGAWFFMPVPNGFGVAGIPDFVGCYKGKFFGIETKAPGRRKQPRRGCSALQWQVGRMIQEAGGVWLVVDGEEDLNEFKKHIQ